ncbi:MAG: 16S rRNA (guanine(966)-N(2))-methyltransferase RsmD [Lachnospiraceae bacterium]|jgi:16S rRNA (guanine966-N2)-methyltransferase
MRVIAGTARSLPLKTVSGNDVRPTTDKTKETLFNVLGFDVPECRFLDLYAGSGAVGIEALSRGAHSCVFVEKSRAALKIIDENLRFTRLSERADVRAQDAGVFLAGCFSRKFDIIFMDPPFGKELEKGSIELIAKNNILEDYGIMVVETLLNTDFYYLTDLGFEIFKVKNYKTHKHVFIRKMVKEQ